MADTLSKLLLAIFFTGALCVMAWMLFFTYEHIDLIVARRRHEKVMFEAEESKAQALAEIEWAKVAPAAPVLKSGFDDQDIHDEIWRARLSMFFEAGNVLGFSVRTLVKAGVVNWRGWIFITNHLSACGVLSVLLTGTCWQHGYNLDRALAELNAGDMPLPQGSAPDVNWACHAQQEKRVVTVKQD